jgi:hypothetical protein
MQNHFESLSQLQVCKSAISPWASLQAAVPCDWSHVQLIEGSWPDVQAVVPTLANSLQATGPVS